MSDIYIYSYHACSLCPIGLGTPEIYHLYFPAKAERPLCSALFSIGLKAIYSVMKWVTGNEVLQTWGFSLGLPCFLAEYPRRQTWWWGNWGQQDIQWAECEPWSPQRVGGETQFHEVVLTGHTTMHVFAWNFTDGIEMTWIVSVLVPIPCLLLLRFVTGRTVCIVFYRYMHSHTRPGRFYYNTQRIGLSIYILQCQRKSMK